MRVSLAIANGCIENVDDFNWIHNNNQTFRANLSDLITADYSFVILRSPFERLASVYLDKIVDKTVEMWQLNDTLKREVDLTNISFRKFVHIVTRPNILVSNIHWRPQVDFLVYKKYDDYFSLENFSNDYKIIEKKTGIKIYDARSLTKHGADQYKKLSEKEKYSDVPSNEISNMKQKGMIPSHHSLYDDKLYEMVSKSYRADIELYENKIGTIRSIK